jgi:hypothetical protein
MDKDRYELPDKDRYKPPSEIWNIGEVVNEDINELNKLSNEIEKEYERMKRDKNYFIKEYIDKVINHEIPNCLKDKLINYSNRFCERSKN